MSKCYIALLTIILYVSFAIVKSLCMSKNVSNTLPEVIKTALLQALLDQNDLWLNPLQCFFPLHLSNIQSWHNKTAATEFISLKLCANQETSS